MFPGSGKGGAQAGSWRVKPPSCVGRGGAVSPHTGRKTHRGEISGSMNGLRKAAGKWGLAPSQSC